MCDRSRLSPENSIPEELIDLYEQAWRSGSESEREEVWRKIRAFDCDRATHAKAFVAMRVGLGDGVTMLPGGVVVFAETQTLADNLAKVIGDLDHSEGGIQ